MTTKINFGQKNARTISRRIGTFLAMLLAVSLSVATANAAITSYLELGDSGSDVTELQQFLARDPVIYPSGLVTGYFGLLTQAGVQRFQAAQGIVSSGSPSTTGYGRVGPRTLVRINNLIASGGTQSWDTVPVLTSPTVQASNSDATVRWITNEGTTGQVYFSTVPITMNEETGPRQQPYVSGSLMADTVFGTVHSVNLQGLLPNTTYYFLARSTDSVGNMSMVWPNSFRTAP